MSERIIQVDRQRQPLVTERVADTARRVRHDVAQVEHVLGVDDFAAVSIARRTVTVAPLVVAGVLAARNLLSVAHAVAFRQGVVIGCVGLGLGLDDVVDLVAVDTPQRLADSRAAESVSRLRHLVTAYAVGLPAGRVAVHVHLVVGVLLGQRQHLIAVVGVGQPEVPREVLGTDHLRVQFGLETVETGAAHVGLHARIGARVGHGDREEHVVGLLVVVVEDEAHAVVEEPDVQPHVELRGRLPLHVGVLHGRRQEGRMAVVLPRGEGAVGVVESDAVVTRLTVRHAEFEVVHRASDPLEEGLFADDPRRRSRREESPLVALGEFRGAVVAERGRNDVFLCEVVRHAAEQRHERLLFVLVRRLEVDARIENGHVVRSRTRRVGGEVPVTLAHQLVTERRPYRMFVGEGAVEGQVRREGVADGLRARLGSRTRLADEVRVAVDLAAGVVAAAVVVAVIVVLGRRRKPVDDPPFEIEGARNAIRGGLAVVERFVERGQLGVGVAAAGHPADLLVEAARRRGEHDSPAEGVLLRWREMSNVVEASRLLVILKLALPCVVKTS